MHGLIFVTWEKYLTDRFGEYFLQNYRSALGETPATAPLASRVYSDEALLQGVGVAHEISNMPVETLLHEYGHYFIMNGLTSHLCAYLLDPIHSARELLLKMRDAHAQMRLIPDGMTPPLFRYKTSTYSGGDAPEQLSVIYDSERQLCPLMRGAIEGAAKRYNEQVRIVESTCMKHGAPECRFDLTFMKLGRAGSNQETPEQKHQRAERQKLADVVLSVLPWSLESSITLSDLQLRLQRIQVPSRFIRPAMLFEALRHLQLAGLIASTANHPGDEIASRRYWRVPIYSD